MVKSLKIALAQIHCSVGADQETLSHNIEELRKAIAMSNSENCDLVVAPELAVCGYWPGDLLLRDDIMDEITAATNNFCDELLSPDNNVPMIFGAPRLVQRIRSKGYFAFPQGLYSLTALDLGDSALANAIMCVNSKSQRIDEVYKVHLPNWGVFDEPRIFACASSVAFPVEISGVKVGVLNCRDVWHESSIASLVDNGAQCIVVPNASPFAHSRHKERIRVVGGFAKKYGVPIVYVNTYHGCDDIVFDGGSFVVDHNGELIHQSPRWSEDFSVVEIVIPEVSVRNELVNLDLDTSGLLDQWDFDASDTYSAIVLGLRDYINSVSINANIVVGISGGVDSALVATLAVDALGSERVHGVVMPSKYTSDESIKLATQLQKRLGITVDTIPINNLFDSASVLLDLDSHDSIVSENIQARLRAIILMTQSNAKGFLVLCTSNKSELAVGYSTLYGDSIGAYAPIKDVYKTQVYELCRWRNRSDGFNITSPIPQEIIDRVPTAELRENQIDEDTLLPYNVLDSILEKFVEQDLSIEEIVEHGQNIDDVNRVVGLVKQSEFKRKQSPIGPRMSRRDFGKSRRIPTCAKW